MDLDVSPELLEPIKGIEYRKGTIEEFDSQLKDWISGQGWSCRTWTDGPSTTHSPHDHPYSHRVLCVSGWIEFTVQDSTVRLEPGDALDLPEGVTHSAVTSPVETTEYWLLRKSS